MLKKIYDFFDLNNYDDIIPNLSINIFEDYNKNFHDKISLDKYKKIRQKFYNQKKHEELVREWDIILPKEKFDKLVNLMLIRIVNNYGNYNSNTFEFNINDFTKESIPSFLKQKLKKELSEKLEKYEIYIGSFYFEEHYENNNHILALTNNPMYGF